MRLHPEFLSHIRKILQEADMLMSGTGYESGDHELTHRSKMLLIQMMNFQIEVKKLDADIQNYQRKNR